MSSERKIAGSRHSQPTDLRGGEEFSEKIYDNEAPTPSEFAQDHKISVTGAPLPEPANATPSDSRKESESEK